MAIKQDEIRFKVLKEDQTIGQVYRVTALAPSGRILAVVEVQIPLTPGFTLAQRIGEDKVKKIEDNTRDIAKRVAEGVIRSPKP